MSSNGNNSNVSNISVLSEKQVIEEKVKLEKLVKREEDLQPKARMLEAYDRNEPDKAAINKQLVLMKQMYGI